MLPESIIPQIGTKLNDILCRLSGVDPSGNGFMARCPCHEDKKNSLSIKEGTDGRILIHCFAGCSTEDIVHTLGLTMADLMSSKSPEINKKKTDNKGKKTIICTYDYHGMDGRLLYQVCRMDPKDFRQRRPGPDEPGKWIWNMQDVPHVPYRLPQVLEAQNQQRVIFVVEGEKDADNLISLGLPATCNHGGAGKWKRSHTEFFRPGAKTVVLVDNDDPGRKHGTDVANKLATVGCRVKLIELPGLPPKGDVSDWLEAGHTKEELLTIVKEAQFYQAIPTSDGEKIKKDGSSYNEDPVHYTDLGNAQRMVEAHGSDIRYCWSWGAWHIWNGAFFERDERGTVIRLAKEKVRSMYGEARYIADDEKRAAFIKFVLRSEGESRLNAMVSLARSEPGIPVLPSDFDRNPWLLCVKNGTIDLLTGKLLEHRKEDLITKIVPIEYDPTAKCPLWLEFLQEIMDAKQDMIDFLQRAVGYSLTGDVSEHVLLILYGNGANGKTVFLSTLLALAGAYGKQAAPDLLLAKRSETHPTELADLQGVRALVSSETDEGRRLAESLVKSLTGGDRVKARFMRQDFFEFSPTHKIWLATNHKPIVRGSDNGIWRRLRLIPFSISIPEAEQDKHLLKKLLNELPGILNWAVEGCLAWQKNGLSAPEEVQIATGKYRAQMDALKNFLDNCCIVQPFAKVLSSKLYGEYLTWAKGLGEYEMSHKMFSMRLQERGFEVNREKSGVWFQGIGLKVQERTGVLGKSVV